MAEKKEVAKKVVEKKVVKKGAPLTTAEINKNIFKHIVAIAEDSQFTTLLVDIDVLRVIPEDIKLPEQLRIILVTRSSERFKEMEDKKVKNKVLLPEADMAQESEISTSLLLALAHGLIKGKHSQTMCLFGHKPKTEDVDEIDGVEKFAQLDAIKIVDNESFSPVSGVLSESKPEKINVEVLERVIKLAIAFAIEGKEGQPFGAIFVIGDTKTVSKFSEDLDEDIYRPKTPRSILGKGMKEKLRRYASMDGAVRISGSGRLVAVCQNLIASLSDEKKLPQGFGTRHAHAAAITEKADCIAVVISQSSGLVTVFVGGKVVLPIKKTSPSTTATTKD